MQSLSVLTPVYSETVCTPPNAPEPTSHSLPDALLTPTGAWHAHCLYRRSPFRQVIFSIEELRELGSDGRPLLSVLQARARLLVLSLG